MRHTDRAGGFLLTLLINLIINWEGTVPALILLALHFAIGWQLWYVWLALGIWAAVILIGTLLIVWAAGCSDRTIIPQPENKNPYSVGSQRTAQAVRKCPACGAPLDGRFRFCPMCSAPLPREGSDGSEAEPPQ